MKEADFRGLASARAYHVFVLAAWKEILGSAVEVNREGDFSKDLKDKDVKAVIEAATVQAV